MTSVSCSSSSSSTSSSSTTPYTTTTSSTTRPQNGDMIVSEYAIGRLANNGTFIRFVQSGLNLSGRCASCNARLVVGHVMEYELGGAYYCVCPNCHEEVETLKSAKTVSSIHGSMSVAVKEFMEKVRRHEQARVR